MTEEIIGESEGRKIKITQSEETDEIHWKYIYH
jgi:hypothetical protein